MTTIDLIGVDVVRIQAALNQMDAALAIKRRRRREVAIILAANSLVGIFITLLRRALDEEVSDD